MKKIILFCIVFGVNLSIHATATPPQQVTGTVEPIVIKGIFELVVETYKVKPSQSGNDTFVGDITPNLTFGTVDLSGAGVIVSQDPNAEPYLKQPHRSGNHYTEARIIINNNVANQFQVSFSLSGNLVELSPNSNSLSESVIHLRTDSWKGQGTEPSTQYPNNIKDIGKPMDVSSNTNVILYKNELSGIISDAFIARIFLDNLPLVIPAGIYTGRSVITLTSL